MSGFDPQASYAACATALPAIEALVRLSGPQAVAIATAGGLQPPAAWHMQAQQWRLPAGACPCRVAFFPGGRSFTGLDLIEISLPGAPDLVALALAHLQRHGAVAAPPGAFTRQALASGRLSLPQAGALLALSQAGDAAAAALALDRLRSSLASELAALRARLLRLRALVEAGLDFIDEAGVEAWQASELQAALAETEMVLARCRRAAQELGNEPEICLAGPANAGKSALFAALTGAPALVSPIAGTTRDWLQADLELAGRRLRLLDTAGWLQAGSGGELDQAALAAGTARLAQAALILLCSAPDARLPEALPPLPSTVPRLILATKSDLGDPDPRAELQLSSHTGAGLRQLRQRLAEAVADCGAAAGPPPQAALGEAVALTASLAARLPPDEILAAELRRLSDLLGDLLGLTTSDEVLDHIFASFCIGK